MRDWRSCPLGPTATGIGRQRDSCFDNTTKHSPCGCFRRQFSGSDGLRNHASNSMAPHMLWGRYVYGEEVKRLTLVILTHVIVTLLMTSDEEDFGMLPWEYPRSGRAIRRNRHMPRGRGTGRPPRPRASTWNGYRAKLPAFLRLPCTVDAAMMLLDNFSALGSNCISPSGLDRVQAECGGQQMWKMLGAPQEEHL